MPQPNGILNNLGYPFGLVGTCCASVYHARLTSHPCVTKTPTTQFHATLSPRTLSKTDCGYLVAHSLHRWLDFFQVPHSRSVELRIRSTYNHVLCIHHLCYRSIASDHVHCLPILQCRETTPLVIIPQWRGYNRQLERSRTPREHYWPTTNMVSQFDCARYKNAR